MSDFMEISAGKLSLAMRKPVHGVGVNDSSYITQRKINGKRVVCPYYRSWINMLNRCYNPAYQEKYPTYKGCTVTTPWLMFSEFRRWMESQDWKGKQLDKDILIPGNKIYGPAECIFVSGALNMLFANTSPISGPYPTGVCINKPGKGYIAQCRSERSSNFLGLFATIKEAETTYLIFKSNLIKRTANKKESNDNPKLKAALLMYAGTLENKAINLLLKAGE